MGTRGFIGVVINGDLKIGYNHCDSYPSHLGEHALKWAKDATRPDVLAATRTAAEALTAVDTETPPTPEQVEALSGFANKNVGSGRMDDWYVLLRETQGDLAAILRAGFIEDAGDFPGDSLFCEWGYLIDLDAEVFEVYRGFVTGAAEGRFKDMPRTDSGYAPVTLAASWPFADLPDELDQAALSGSDDL